MASELVGVAIGSGIILFLNLAGFIYLFGRLSEKVSSLNKRIDKLDEEITTSFKRVQNEFNKVGNHISEINKKMDNFVSQMSWLRGKLGLNE